ncbi:RNase A-like domain-containing protein [Bordetella sp. LUAb4]|uniref:RNase A-like domain-containing protein n=1 Tax=Bordetella sp. LUAb4 TaxID=2843195 RepID=UPI001E47B4C7|nr:RNase A-like domain-containing protein [Bordetella sp. LUAb4]
MDHPHQSQAFVPFAQMGYPNQAGGFAPFVSTGYSNQSDGIAPHTPMDYPNPFDQHVIPYPQHPLPPHANPNKPAASKAYPSQAGRGSRGCKRRSPSPSTPPARNVPNLRARAQAGRDRSESPGFVPDCADAFPSLNGHSTLPQASRKAKDALDAPFGSRVPQRQKHSSDAACGTRQRGAEQNLPEITLNKHIEVLHVGQTEEELKERQQITRLPICSTFYDREIALAAIKAAIAANLTKIRNWLSDPNGSRRLEVVSPKADAPVGTAVFGSDPNPRPVGSAKVILQRDAADPRGFIEITAFPIWP